MTKRIIITSTLACTPALQILVSFKEKQIRLRIAPAISNQHLRTVAYFKKRICWRADLWSFGL